LSRGGSSTPREILQQGLEARRKTDKIPIRELADRPLQRPDRPARCLAERLTAASRHVQSHRALIRVVTLALDPAALRHALQDMADRRPLHAELVREPRCRHAGLLPDAGECAMQCDRRAGHLFEFAIERPHPVYQGARREQRLGFAPFPRFCNFSKFHRIFPTGVRRIR